MNNLPPDRLRIGQEMGLKRQENIKIVSELEEGKRSTEEKKEICQKSRPKKFS